MAYKLIHFLPAELIDPYQDLWEWFDQKGRDFEQANNERKTKVKGTFNRL